MYEFSCEEIVTGNSGHTNDQIRSRNQERYGARPKKAYCYEI